MTLQRKIVAVIVIFFQIASSVSFPRIPSVSHGSHDTPTPRVLHLLQNLQGCVPAVGRCRTHAHTRSLGEILKLVETDVSASRAL